MSFQRDFEIHVIIPAAGHSRRMGQPKLLMKIGRETVIARLLRQLMRLKFASLRVLGRAEDEELQAEVRKAGAEFVVPEFNPPDMRVSVELLLDAVGHSVTTDAEVGWLLIPADHPIVEQSVLERLIESWQETPDRIVVPVNSGHRGHPAVFPWSSTQELSKIPQDQGINWLLRHGGNPVREIECSEASVLWDLDTPDDFAKIQSLLQN